MTAIEDDPGSVGPAENFEQHDEDLSKFPSDGNVKTIAEYVDFIARQRSAGGFRLYRGQARPWTLRPGIGRLRKALEEGGDEYPIPKDAELLREFKRRSWSFLASRPESEWDWLATAQHYGLATRLLDWSENALFALWIAVKDHEHHGDQFAPCVWFLTASVEFGIDPDDRNTPRSPFEVGGTRVFRPRHLSDRLRAQGGWFTIHAIGRKRGSFENVVRNSQSQGSSYNLLLKRIDVDGCEASAICSHLRQLGVHEATMFPEPSGVCDYLRHYREQYANGEVPL